MDKQKIKSVINRFLKGLLSGGFTALGLVSVATPQSWTDIWSFLNMLAIAFVGGAINGLILAGIKWASWKN